MGIIYAKPTYLWLYYKNDQKITINFILDKYIYDTWLWLYNFSKICVLNGLLAGRTACPAGE